ncbi:DUF4062 domain-containing protein [Clostridiales bacterium FE2010]|nr:DUF4062 domain-containing protein [Clostridiales bacterium FE2010]
MAKKYQVFISSTYEDLREERDKVRDAILSMYHFPVGMELFGAANEEQWEIIKETIDTSDYYVLIVGQRYGSVIPDGPDKEISYTEKEFRYAKEKEIPILAFLIDDSVPVKAAHVEKKHIKEFEKFKTAVKSGRTVQWWENADDLAQKVTAALHKQIERTPRQGWMRAEDLQLEDQSSEFIRLYKEKQALSDEYEKLLEERKHEMEKRDNLCSIANLLHKSYESKLKYLDYIEDTKQLLSDMEYDMRILEDKYFDKSKEAKHIVSLYKNAIDSTNIYNNAVLDIDNAPTWFISMAKHVKNKDMKLLKDYLESIMSEVYVNTIVTVNGIQIY